MFRSLVYLLGLFFTRFIPLKIFWGLYSLAERVKMRRGPGLLIPLVVLSYGASLLALSLMLLVWLNFSFAHNLQLVWLPLWVEPEKLNPKNYSLLISPLVYSKFFRLAGKIIFSLLEYLALISVGFGAAEIRNDYSSHLNPDYLDLMFPANGAVLFYGGFTLFVLVGFFLYFLLAPRNLRKWKQRVAISSQLAPGWQRLIISPALLHPYFFLSPGAKHFCVKYKIEAKRIALLFNKALIENRDIISLEWLEKNWSRS